MDSSAIDRGAGNYRISCAEPCELVSLDGYRRHGVISDLGRGGVYAVLRAPFPPVGRTVLLTFMLPGESRPVTCEARVQWHNPPSGLEGRGSVKLAFPPGCGLSFRVLDPQDAARIAARVLAGGKVF
jgi:PilZ domain